MNTFLLQRLTFLALLPLCTCSSWGLGARKPSATPDAPASAASVSAAAAPEDAQESAHQHRRHRRQPTMTGATTTNTKRSRQHRPDSESASRRTADSVVSIFVSSDITDGNAGDVVSILGDHPGHGEVSDSAVAVLAIPMSTARSMATPSPCREMELGPMRRSTAMSWPSADSCSATPLR